MYTNVLRILGAAALLSCSWTMTACSRPDDQAPLRAGAAIFTGYAPLARALRTYTPAGGAAPVQFHKFSAYADSLRAMRNGRLDLLPMTNFDGLLLISRGVPLRAVAVIDQSVGADAIVCQPEFTSLRGLRGRRIGLQAESVSHFFLMQELDRQHLGAEEFELVHLSPNLVEAAFRDRRVEAAVLWEPFVSNLGRRCRVLATSRAIEIPIVDLLWVRQDRLASLREDVAPLLRHYFEALDELRTQPEAVHAELAAEDQVTPREVRVALQGLRMFGGRENLALAHSAAGTPDPPTETGLRAAADFMYRETVLEVPLDASGLFDGSLLVEALETAP